MRLTVENKLTKTMYDLSEMLRSVTFFSNMDLSPNRLVFSYYNPEKDIGPENGATVKFYYENKPIFLGYVFSVKRDDTDEIQVTAYDQLRYLRAKDSMTIEGMTLDQLIRKIGNSFRLKIGSLEPTGYVLPGAVYENKTLLDMIGQGISDTLYFQKKRFILYDSFGSLTLKNIEKMKLDLLFGDESFMTGYRYTRSIDQDTYTQVKLNKIDRKTSYIRPYVVNSEPEIEKWGVLQYTETAEKDLNEEQIRMLARQILNQKKKETKEFSVNTLGNIAVMGGSSIMVAIGDLAIRKYYAVKEVTHLFQKESYTMRMELIDL